MKRRAILVLSIVGLSTVSLAAPALADDSSTNDPLVVCVQFPGSNPRGPAPGYCLYVPDPR